VKENIMSISRRKLLSSIALVPVGGLLSRAVAQTGVYGFGSPPAPKPYAGTPARFDKSCVLPAPTETALLEMTRAARERMRLQHFPDVVLRTQDNQKVRFYTDLIKDKIVILNFYYAKCEGVCPGVTANLVKLQKLFGERMGRDIFMYSLTLKPEHDGPRDLKGYASKFGVGPGWTFLTGSGDDIEAIRRGIGFVDPNPVVDRDKSQHIGNIRYGNEPLVLWGACPGMSHATWLVKEISSVIQTENRSS
jgi:protein SCO1/2